MAARMVKMRVVVDRHTHCGEMVDKDTVIEVPDFRAAWLTKHGVAVPVVEEKKSSSRRSKKKDQESAEEAPADTANEGEEDAPSE